MVHCCAADTCTVHPVRCGCLAARRQVRFWCRIAAQFLGLCGRIRAHVCLFFRMLFGHAVRPYLSRYRYIGYFTDLFERHPFISLLLVRLIPVIPAQAVNLYCSASLISLLPYTLATAIGKIPMIAVFVFAGDQLLDNPGNALLIFMIYAVLLLVLAGGFRYYRRAGKL